MSPEDYVDADGEIGPEDLALARDRDTAKFAAFVARSSAKRRRRSGKGKVQKGRHGKRNPAWCTPDEHLQLALAAMNAQCFDLDVMSSERANERVEALRFYDGKAHGDALAQEHWFPWPEPPEIEGYYNLLCNPYGGLVVPCWQKVKEQYAIFQFQMIWIGFSVEQLCLVADPLAPGEELTIQTAHPTDFSMCYLRKRVSFFDEQGRVGESPSHSNYVCGIGVIHDRFEEIYAPHGRVTRGVFSV